MQGDKIAGSGPEAGDSLCTVPRGQRGDLCGLAVVRQLEGDDEIDLLVPVPSSSWVVEITPPRMGGWNSTDLCAVETSFTEAWCQVHEPRRREQDIEAEMSSCEGDDLGISQRHRHVDPSGVAAGAEARSEILHVDVWLVGDQHLAEQGDRAWVNHDRAVSGSVDGLTPHAHWTTDGMPTSGRLSARGEFPATRARRRE